MKFVCDDARGHGQNRSLFCGGNCIYFCIGEFDLSGVNILDQFVAVHEIDANDVVVQHVDNVYWVCKFLSIYSEVHLIDPYRVHCVPGGSDAAL